MARAASTDPYQGFRFHVIDPTGGNLDPVAGFKSVSTPNISLNAVEYREGTYTFTRKFPGVPTVGEVVLGRGVLKGTSDFFAWISRTVLGGRIGEGVRREYRTDLLIQQYHVTDEFGSDGTPSRVINIKNCFPTDCKPTGDFDAEDDAIQLAELTLTVEDFSIIELPSSSTVAT